MTREIKFRGWDSQAKKMWFDGSSAVSMILQDSIDGAMLLPQKGIILMQFTGLKDKNGEEIYEGDIIRTADKESIYHKMPEYIAWEDGGFQFKRKDGYWERFHSLYAENCEVIGNIYENQELLK